MRFPLRLSSGLALTLVLLAVPSALALVRLPAILPLVPGNPAERLVALPIEDSTYDAARRCTPKAARPGVAAMQRWLEANVRGVFWGSYRCEKWGRDSASLHAEKRAIDWHLDVTAGPDRRAAGRLIRLLLAPDSLGNQQALARRMGVEELIWDCGYWSAGMTAFKPYSPCYGKSGRLRKGVNATAAHRDHVHIGMTHAGAAARTSFWTQPK